MKVTHIFPATADKRGWIADILYKHPIQHVAIVHTDTVHALRGNHYHARTTQYMYMVKGCMNYWYQPLDKSQPVQLVVACVGDLIETPPFEIHTLDILEAGTEFIVLADGVRGGDDYESDTIRVLAIYPRLEKSHETT